MKSKKYLIFGMLVLFSLSLVSAITGSIGNARMILREVDGEEIEVGDVIEKYVLVKNVNNVSINIELFAGGDLAESIDIVDNNFTLAPGESKKAYFTIEVAKGGTTTSNVNVQFSPIEKGNGVGLSSTIIIITEEEKGFFSSLFGGGDEDDEDGDTDLTGDVVAKVKLDKEKTNPAVVFFMLVMTGFLVALVFLFLLILRNKKLVVKKTKPKKSAKRNV